MWVDVSTPLKHARILLWVLVWQCSVLVGLRRLAVCGTETYIMIDEDETEPVDAPSLSDLFDAYESAEAELMEAEARAEEAKNRRSEAGEAIYRMASELGFGCGPFRRRGVALSVVRRASKGGEIHYYLVGQKKKRVIEV